jgi:hypothetical protein
MNYERIDIRKPIKEVVDLMHLKAKMRKIVFK